MDIWDSLKQKYQGTTRVKRAQLQALHNKFEILHMKERESVNEYFACALTVANKMRIHGGKMEDVVVIKKILRSMIDKYDYVWECPKKGKDSKGFYAETSEEMLLMAYVDIKEVNREELWFLDSGCSNHMCSLHMCGKNELFTTLDDTFRKFMKIGNDSSLDVLGKGNVRMEVNRIMQVIIGVFYVPGLKHNLLSIGQLQEKGLAIFIKNGNCRIYHPERRLI
ncbi:uncharacterized protein [Pyrus communis]|uniref:uncharacterized protein n=1 Tax=Pyrus communis TaxID=23211 RepID=UPI0035BF9BDA